MKRLTPSLILALILTIAAPAHVVGAEPDTNGGPETVLIASWTHSPGELLPDARANDDPLDRVIDAINEELEKDPLERVKEEMRLSEEHCLRVCAVALISIDAAAGCTRGPTVASASYGLSTTRTNIAGCTNLLLVKPPTDLIQIAILGDGNDLFCNWERLGEIECSGDWVGSGADTELVLTARLPTSAVVAALA